MVPGHGGGNQRAGHGGQAQADKIFPGKPAFREYMFNPVSGYKIETWLTDCEKRIQEIIHFRGSFKDKEGKNGDKSYKEKI